MEQFNSNTTSGSIDLSEASGDTTGSIVTLKLPKDSPKPQLKPSLLTKWLLWQLASFSQTPKRSRMAGVSRRSPVRRWVFWSLVLFLTVTVSAMVGATLALVTPLASVIAPQDRNRSLSDLWREGFFYRLSRPINILVMGIDRVPGASDYSPSIFNGRSDTMLLLRIDPTDNSVKVLSIPRDTHVEHPDLTINKINQANADGGPALTARVVSGTLNDVPIDRYIRVTTDAFRELVDLVGGIEVFVPKQMYYVDKTQQLEINLSPGWQTLNGLQTEQFARFRSDNYGDIGRVQRQQVLLKALRERLIGPTVLPQLPQMFRVMQKYVDTNLSWEEMLALANFALKLDRTDVKMVMLPGRFSGPKEYIASYWIMDAAGRDRVMRDYFTLDFQQKASDTYRPPEKVRIAIQNASGQPQMSHRVARYLRSLGFRNLYIVRDWPQSELQTRIVVQQGDLEAAETLKRALGLGDIEAASTGDIESDLTLRVGEDWPDSVALKKF